MGLRGRKPAEEALTPPRGRRLVTDPALLLPDDQCVISFGGGVSLMSEDYFVRAFLPFGITKRSFRHLCRALHVPLVHLNGMAFVDPVVFQVAIKCIARAGAPEFTLPRGTTARVLTGRSTKTRTSIPIDEVRENWEFVVRSILDARNLSSLASPAAYRDIIQGAALELARLAERHVPSGLQKRYERALKESTHDGRATQGEADQGPGA